MYTIGQAAARTRITVPVLRAWERRYGIVEPKRTQSGYRMYDDVALDRLREMKRLVEEGWSPSLAAAAIVGGTAPPPVHRGETDHTDEADDAQGLVEPFLVAAADLDVGRIESILDDMFASGSFERVAERYLLPSLEALGQAWADGRIDVGAEHMASHAVLRRLTAAFEAAGTGGDAGGAVLIGLPPGARHELGALAFAVALRRARVPVVYLGPDLPTESWVSAALRLRARAAVIGAVTPADRESARAVATGLRAARRDLVIAFGGRFQPAEWPDGPDSSVDPPFIRLPVGLAESVRALIDALEASTLA